MDAGNVFCTFAPILEEPTRTEEPVNKNKSVFTFTNASTPNLIFNITSRHIIDKLLTMNVAELTKGQLAFLNKILPQESQLVATEGYRLSSVSVFVVEL